MGFRLIVAWDALHALSIRLTELKLKNAYTFKVRRKFYGIGNFSFSRTSISNCWAFIWMAINWVDCQVVLVVRFWLHVTDVHTKMGSSNPHRTTEFVWSGRNLRFMHSMMIKFIFTDEISLYSTELSYNAHWRKQWVNAFQHFTYFMACRNFHFNFISAKR